MSNAPDYLVFDGDPSATPPVLPRRPSLEDLGGAHLVNYDEPIPETMLASEDMNQVERVVHGIAAVVPAAVLTVRVTTSPAIIGMQCLSETLQISDFTLTVGGVGETTITCAAGKLPVTDLAPSGLTINSATLAVGYANKVTNGVHVITYNPTTGAAADADYSVQIFGA